MTTLFTIGHSTRTSEDFLRLVHEAGVRAIVDIRAAPFSRRYPHFNTEILRETVEREAVAYRHDAALGGRRPKRTDVDRSWNEGWSVATFRNFADYAMTAEFSAALDALLAQAADVPTAILCSEAVWWRCHRRIIADYALHRGASVRHILSETKIDDGSLTPFAKPQDDGTIRYPLLQPSLL